ncbi:MAG: MerR family transcriptional regulator [Candidatus Gastranaerophilales bacterium]|nr:MerR family transcriptional regulator [Candidatus Gastranaerophilales bacterium]
MTLTKEKKNPQALSADKPMFPISVVADILKIHQRTLRIYDEANILVPSRSPKNRRVYSMNDIERGKFVQYLTRELGINLSGIKIIFTLLEKQNIPKDDYIPYLQDIAESLNITPEIQQENREKLSRRGRKKSAK